MTEIMYPSPLIQDPMELRKVSAVFDINPPLSQFEFDTLYRYKSQKIATYTDYFLRKIILDFETFLSVPEDEFDTIKRMNSVGSWTVYLKGLERGKEVEISRNISKPVKWILAELNNSIVRHNKTTRCINTCLGHWNGLTAKQKRHIGFLISQGFEIYSSSGESYRYFYLEKT